MSDDSSPQTPGAVLRERFGHSAFQGDQEAAVNAVLAGRDVLLVTPTGGGKSVAYQLPALLLDGTTLVVSPLIALMQDQVDALRRRGIRASFVNSSLTGKQREERLQAATRGEWDLLYVTPERFRSAAFL
ncbi:MAG: DEAD/DEAH box helicase, partial [Planctomycetota bacterium]